MDEVIDLIFPFLKLIKILGVVADSFSSNFSIVVVSKVKQFGLTEMMRKLKVSY